MNKTRSFFICYIFLLGAFSSNLFAQEDMPGSADYPDMARIEGTTIRGYAYSDYDEGEFVTQFANKKLEKVTIAGKRTRILYLAPPSFNSVMVWKNYEEALKTLGEPEEVYACLPETCASKMGKNFIWSKGRRHQTNIEQSDYIYAPLGFSDQRYTYSTYTKHDRRYHVSLFFARLNGIQSKGVKDVVAIHLEILEEADFETTLQVVTPDEITQGINETGRIALYGIYFDVDSDSLKVDSGAALKAIATALNAKPELKIYVAGHTDNQGSYKYNLDLSKRRAESVVEVLRSQHGISSDRLKAVGIGPVSPVASNRTEEGRTLNRRVELVEF